MSVLEEYVIAWQSLITGKEGIGTQPLTKERADILAQELNEQYKGALLHWAVRVKQSPKDGTSCSSASS